MLLWYSSRVHGTVACSIKRIVDLHVAISYDDFPHNLFCCLPITMEDVGDLYAICARPVKHQNVLKSFNLPKIISQPRVRFDQRGNHDECFRQASSQVMCVISEYL